MSSELPRASLRIRPRALAAIALLGFFNCLGAKVEKTKQRSISSIPFGVKIETTPNAAFHAASQAVFHAASKSDSSEVNSRAVLPPVNVGDEVIPRGWHAVGMWQGISGQTTGAFHISASQWVLLWNTKARRNAPPNFALAIHDAQGNLIDMVANATGSGSDNTVIHRGGDFRLEILSLQPYTVLAVAPD